MRCTSLKADHAIVAGDVVRVEEKRDCERFGSEQTGGPRKPLGAAVEVVAIPDLPRDHARGVVRGQRVAVAAGIVQVVQVVDRDVTRFPRIGRVVQVHPAVVVVIDHHLVLVAAGRGVEVGHLRPRLEGYCGSFRIRLLFVTQDVAQPIRNQITLARHVGRVN